MKIQVTQKNIDAGTAGSCTRCPIALAITDVGPKVHPGFRYVTVGDDYVCVYCDGYRRYEYKLPLEAKMFIRDVDALKPVNPIEFELERV
jgi:hypothetical protein